MPQIDVLQSILERARKTQKTIALPESTDPRTLCAARQIIDRKIGRVVLVGDKNKIHAEAHSLHVDLDDIQICDPLTEETLCTNAEMFFDLRKHKGISENDAEQQVCDPLYAAALMLQRGEVDATVAGAVHPTPDVLRPLFQIVGPRPGLSLASSCFVMITKQKHMGHHGAFIYADAGVNPNPTPEQLADIAISSADSCEAYFQVEPRIAMLSFSTMGSASHPDVDKVREATEIACEKRPDLLIEGELQADAALVPEVAEMKCDNSHLRGRANTLIFPDLDAGNIAYKLTQRLCNAGAYGPLLQGLAKVGMDLSRGATIDDVTNVCATAAVLAEHMQNQNAGA
ncbi:MAG: phosphate acetyltransferase [Armatimonadota bacterium]